MKGHSRRKNRRVKGTNKRRRQKGGDAQQPSAAAPPPAAPFPLSVTVPESKIKVFTNADKSQPTLEAMISALTRHKYSYEVLGFGKEWHGFHTRMANYLEGIERYLKEAGPGALAIFVDGFDAICVKDSGPMYEAYKAKVRPMPVVFGAEICCLDNCDKEVLNWYDKYNLKGGKEAIRQKLEQMFPPDEKFLIAPEPVFANAGFIMGTAEGLVDLLKGMIASGNFDDQLAAGAYIVKNLDKVDIDIEEKLVRNKIKNRDKLPDEGTPEGPGFLHYPGMRGDDQKLILLEKYKEFP
jgi:hypothetical protein